MRLPNEPEETLRLYDLSLSRSLTLFKYLFTVPIERKLPPEEAASIKRIFIRSQKTGTQSPLYATIMISPLILLLPINLINLRWSRESLLQASIRAPRYANHILPFIKVARQLGNDKPNFIVEIETLIWQSIVTISLGESNAVNAIQKLIGSIPHDKFLDMENDDPIRNWFKPNETVTVEVNAPQSVSRYECFKDGNTNTNNAPSEKTAPRSADNAHHGKRRQIDEGG
jgi:hypothetical protein